MADQSINVSKWMQLNAARYQQWIKLCDRRDQAGYKALTPDERVWWNTRTLIDSVTNGGIVSYFYNSGADSLDDLLVSLESLGATEVNREVERVFALFPGKIPPDLKARNEVISSWSDDEGYEEIVAVLDRADDRLQELLEDLEKRLAEYLRQRGLQV